MQTHPRQDAKCFVGGLSWSTTAEKLEAYFSNFGQVLEAFVSYDRHTGRPRGFGFVVFEDPAVADKVSSIAHTIDRREVEAKKAVPKENHPGPRGSSQTVSPARTKKVFVGGLTPSIDEAALRQYFEQFGVIQDAVVMYDHENRRPRGFGFVTFCEEESVDAVLSAGPLQAVHDKQVEIKRAVPRDQMPPPRGLPMAGRTPHSAFMYGRGQPYGYPLPYQTQGPYGMPTQPPYGGQAPYGNFARPLNGGAAGASALPGIIGMPPNQVGAPGSLGPLSSVGYSAPYGTHLLPGGGGDMSLSHINGSGMGADPLGMLPPKHMHFMHQQQRQQHSHLPSQHPATEASNIQQRRRLLGVSDGNSTLSHNASLPPPSPVASFANDNGAQSTPTFSAGTVSSPYAGMNPGSPYAGGPSLPGGLAAASLAASHHGSGSYHGGSSFQMSALQQTLPSVQTGSAASDSLMGASGVNSAYATPMAGGVAPLGGVTPLRRTVSQSPGARAFLTSSPSAFDTALAASPLAASLSIPLMPGSAKAAGSLSRGDNQAASFADSPLGVAKATPINWANT